MAGDRQPAPDDALVALLARAHGWAEELRAGTPLSILAQRENVSDAFLRTRIQPAFLSPRIQAAILAGTQPPELTVKALAKNLPLDWSDQEQVLGFSAS
ncbi:hypothetical protein E0K89_000830 [Aquicoccus sp. SCR17]|nr:hypothetical protein [Carideicomes alvinocaridis]